MTQTVIFTSNRPLQRAENLMAVYSAYDGAKDFLNTNPYGKRPDFSTGEYALRVADELFGESPGKGIWIGHGMGAGKTYGLNQPNPYFRSPGVITYAIASSKEMVPIVAGFCGIPEDRVIVTGMPRTDAYFERYKRPDTSLRIYLYAPTFRSSRENANMKVDWDYIDANLQPNEIMIVKPHMMTKHILNKEYERVLEYSSDIPSTKFLLRADVVITDYSSIMFDAFVCKTPVVLFEKDHEKYLAKRGMYFEYPLMYSPMHCRSEDELLEMCRNARWNSKHNKLRKFYAGACDGRSTDRVIKLIRRCLEE